MEVFASVASDFAVNSGDVFLQNNLIPGRHTTGEPPSRFGFSARRGVSALAAERL